MVVGACSGGCVRGIGTCGGRASPTGVNSKLSWNNPTVHAAIAFAGSEPAGWVTYGPRESFPRVAYSRELKRSAPEGTWSIVCFYIPPQWRGKGIANMLLGAAAGYCKAHGAVEIEAFPIELSDPSLRKRATDIYTGVASQFLKAGFELFPRIEKQRAIYVKKP